MITKLMEDTCLKDMQATKLSLRKIVKNLQVHLSSKALQSIPWTSLSSGTPSSTLLLSSSSKIFMKLFSSGVSALTSILRPSSSQPKRATSVQSADTMGFRMTKFPALFVNNITPAALTAWLANHPHRKGSVQAFKRPSKQARIAVQSSSAQARERSSASPESLTAELS